MKTDFNFLAARQDFSDSGDCSSTEFRLQLRRVTAADGKRFRAVLQIDLIRAIEPRFDALNRFEVDDAVAMDAGKVVFGKSRFPLAQRFFNQMRKSYFNRNSGFLR